MVLKRNVLCPNSYFTCTNIVLYVTNRYEPLRKPAVVRTGNKRLVWRLNNTVSGRASLSVYFEHQCQCLLTSLSGSRIAKYNGSLAISNKLVSAVCERTIICLWTGLSSAPHILCYRSFVGPAVKENYRVIIGLNVRYSGSIPHVLFSLVLVCFFPLGVFPS
jgi:hypothetical protein